MSNENTDIIFGSYDVAKPGDLELQLLTYFDQRFDAPNIRAWEKQPWLPPLARSARART